MKQIILILLILTSCSAEKRCQKHVNKAIAGGCLVNKIDTIFDTIIGFKTDTIFKSDSLTLIDTFTQIKNNVQVKTIVKWKEKTITQTITARDTIIKYEQKIQVIKGKDFNIVKYIWFFLLFLGLLVLSVMKKQ